METALKISYRFLANAALFLSIFFSPWWVTAVLLLGTFFLFKKFYEAFVWTLVADFLYGTPVTSFYGFYFFTTIGALALYVSVEWMKMRMRFYE